MASAEFDELFPLSRADGVAVELEEGEQALEPRQRHSTLVGVVHRAVLVEPKTAIRGVDVTILGIASRD